MKTKMSVSEVETTAPGNQASSPERFIRTRHLTLQYGEESAFEDVSLSARRGCVTALIGPSGCGKTSFLSALNRLSDLTANCRVTGEILIGDTDVLSPTTDVIALRRRVGMIFQTPNPFPLSIRKNLEFPLREHGIRDRSEVDAVIEAALRDVGLWSEVQDRLDASALSLSGGQQQRLCIARALALKPEALLLDEPCSALDPIASGVVEDLLKSLGGRYTLVIVTHNLSQAKRIADDVAFFWIKDNAGRLVEFGTAAQVFTDPQDELTRAYVSGERG